MSETCITLRNVKERLRGLETKYGFRSDEFRSDPECRSRVTDQDEFEWESCLVHAEVLHEKEEELHRQYLSHGVSQPREGANNPRAALDLVA